MTQRSGLQPRKHYNTLGSRNRSWTTEPKPTRSDWSGKRRPAEWKRIVAIVNNSERTEPSKV